MVLNKVILLVDGNRMAARDWFEGLQAAGYQVLQADSAETAMPLCEQTCPDLAVLSVHLSGISGLALAAWLKGALNVPFIFFSDRVDALEEAARLGALGYLLKPMEIQQVLPAIYTALVRAGEIRRLRQVELDLNRALKNSRSLSMAIGLLMQRFEISADQTFAALRGYCRSHRMRMSDVADRLIDQRQDVDLLPYLSR